MKTVFWLVLAGLLVLGYPTTCYVRTRLAVAECARSCEEQGLRMSSYILEDPVDAFADGDCICLSDAGS